MGLTKVFMAQDTVWWRHFEAAESRPTDGSDPESCLDANGNPRRWGFEHDTNDRIGWANWPNLPPIYSPDLVTNGRVYGEEPFQRYASGSHSMYGAMWAQKEGLASTINLFIPMRQAAWPSWNASVWKFDSASGVCLRRTPTKAVGVEGVSVLYDRFTAETLSGRLWWFGLHADAYYHSFIGIDPTTFKTNGLEIDWNTFDDPPGNTKNATSALGLDQDQGVAYVRWTGNPVRAVDAYKRRADGTWAWTHRIWAGAAVDQILLTDVGLVYLIDQNDWLSLYSAGGAYQGAVRNPRSAACPFGYMYAWDRFYRRLLFLAGTENEADGASTMRIEGFYPIPQATNLTPPIPLARPRKGKRLCVLAHFSGEGGEPIASTRGVLKADGTPVAQASADAAGDFTFAYTPESSGPVTMEVVAPWP